MIAGVSRRAAPPVPATRLSATAAPRSLPVPLKGMSGAEVPMAPSSHNATTIGQRLADRIGHHTYDLWFSHAARLSVAGECVAVAANTRFTAAWIDREFQRDLDEVAREALGASARVDVHVAPQLFDAAPALATANGTEALGAPASPARPAIRPTAPQRRAPLRRLDDFVVGDCNRLAYTAALRFAEGTSPGGPDSGGPAAGGASGGVLFVHGECGVGKTHLLQGTVERHLERGDRRGQASSRYVSAEQFTNEYIHAVRGGGLDRFRCRIRRLELLAVDDLHFIADKKATRSEFLHTLDALAMAGGRVVVASNEHPHRLGVPEALTSRLMAGTVAPMERPDSQTRLRLLQRLAAARGMSLSEPAASMIVAECTGSIRELEGAVNKLAALRELAGGDGEVGALLAGQVFCERHGTRPRVPLRIETVIEEVCRRLVVDRAQLLGAGRHPRVVAARSLVSYLARRLTTLSYPEIAAALGRKHHSTVHTAVRRMTRQLHDDERLEVGADSRFRDLVDQLQHEILKHGRGGR